MIKEASQTKCLKEVRLCTILKKRRNSIVICCFKTPQVVSNLTLLFDTICFDTAEIMSVVVSVETDSRSGSNKNNSDTITQSVHKEKEKEEKWHQTTIQVSVPFMLAGVGTIGAGVILGRVEVTNLKDVKLSEVKIVS